MHMFGHAGSFLQCGTLPVVNLKDTLSELEQLEK